MVGKDNTSSVLSASTFSVLVIEDDDQLREGLVASFELDGYRAAGEADAEKALAAMKASRPDIVVCDHILRSMDGLSLLNEMRRTPELADIPVVVISVQQSTSFEKTCHLVGANEVFSKPFSVRDLLQSIRRLLECPPPAAARS